MQWVMADIFFSIVSAIVPDADVRITGVPMKMRKMAVKQV